MNSARMFMNIKSLKSIANLVLPALLLAVGVLLSASTGPAATARTSTATANWGTAATWSPNGVPAAGDTITILSGHTVTIAAAALSPATLTINSGGQLTVGGYNLTVTGATTVNGTLEHNSTAGTHTFTGNVTINSGGAWNVTAAATITCSGNVTNNSGGTWSETAAATISFAGNLQNDGTFTASTGTHTFTGSATKTFSGINEISIPNVAITGAYQNNGILTVGTALSGSSLVNSGTGTLNLGGATTTAISITTLTATASGNAVNYTGAAQTVKATAYRGLTLSGSSVKTMPSGTSVTGNLSIAPAGNATASIAAGVNLSVGSLTLGGLGRTNGTWGSTSSTATSKNNTYFEATTGYLTVNTDNRATPTVSVWPTASSIVVGQALSRSTLTGGTASVPGSFAFTVPQTVPPMGSSNYSAAATFTPTDNTSYSSVSNTISMTVLTPVITVQPQNGVVAVGGSASLSVTNSGTAPVGYQ